ncbi:hypothetical protein ACFSJY_11215 [Thalassotalea euphylliae]|uniref:hypothetical protein n=1 Tax=Thalassotalea euphylliae TaxID=1655234 RepID=UPI003632378C
MMNELTFSFSPLEIKTEFDWQLWQELNVFEGDELIAKAEFEVITLNKNRGAKETYEKLDDLGATDWELPLNLFFTKQNLNPTTSKLIEAKTNDKKAQQHIMLEALSVTPNRRRKGIARLMLQKIVEEHNKAQSLFTLAMPMSNFVDADACELESDKVFYQSLDLINDDTNQQQVVDFFSQVGFKALEVDESLLAEPLPYALLVSSPQLIAKEQ